MDLSRRTLLAGAGTVAAVSAIGADAASPARAQSAPMGQAPGYYRYKVGDIVVTVLNDGVFQFPLGAIRRPAEDVNAALAASFLPTGHLLTPFNGALINTGSKTVLIDTGNGAARAPTAGRLLANLRAAGVDPKAVDTIVMSHFHGDHIGGLLDAQGAPNYPNAEILVPAGEWAFWMDEGSMSRAPDAMKGAFNLVRKTFGALKGKVAQYEAGKEVAPGITSMDTSGHTIGHTSHVVASGTAKLLVQADVTALAATLIVQNPDWAIGGDMDAAKAVTTRKRVYDMVVAERMPVLGYHMPFPAIGHIAKDGSSYRWVPTQWNPVL